ncbi:MAG: hypothetical protein Kow0054_20900 [Deferrisoma sp.]
MEGLLGVHLQVAAQVHQREQEVPEFLGRGRAVALGHGPAQLAELLVHLFEHLVGSAPVEPHAGRLFRDPAGPVEGREPAGHALEGAPVPLLLRLDPGPRGGHLVRGVGPRLPEHVGVAAHELLADLREAVGHGEPPLLPGHLGQERHLQEHVPELLPKPGPVAPLHGLLDLVGFLHQVGGDGLRGLLPVPGAPVGRPEPLDDLQEPQEPLRRVVGKG